MSTRASSKTLGIMFNNQSYIHLPFPIMSISRQQCYLFHVSFSLYLYFNLPSQSSTLSYLGFSFSHIMGHHGEERLFKIYTSFGNILDVSCHTECNLLCSLFRADICRLASGLFFLQFYNNCSFFGFCMQNIVCILLIILYEIKFLVINRTDLNFVALCHLCLGCYFFLCYML